ncbi:MAG: RloB domain-containing protein [Deltaproteobacteria bacterium]|nr:RloB domain-containing protein [Deltaproteobacteria bacterium]
MGTDNLFHKRKARKAEMHRRRIATLSPLPRVLIVCEGGKTEPHYFRWLINYFGLNRANVVIGDKKNGLDPKRLVDYALEEYNKERDFDHVYCVFDRDKHATYDATVDKIRSVRLRKGATIHATTSIPCFEFWLLLHFTYTTRQYDAPINESNCELVVSDLRKHIPDYDKGSQNFLIYLVDKTEEAISNAKQLGKFHESSGTDNPSTKIYVLVEYLKSLKR